MRGQLLRRHGSGGRLTWCACGGRHSLSDARCRIPLGPIGLHERRGPDLQQGPAGHGRDEGIRRKAEAGEATRTTATVARPVPVGRMATVSILGHSGASLMDTTDKIPARSPALSRSQRL